MPSDETLSKAELQLIDKIIVAVGLAKFRNILWQKVRQAFGFSFHGTNIEYGFARATPDERALAYIEDRIFILSDKTQAKLVGDLRWEFLEGIKNAESVDEIKRRLDRIFKGNTVNTERIARTEVLNAQNAGRQSAYEESEVTHYKMWKAAMKNPRTAADSKRLNGQLQEVGNPFVDPKTGDSFMHPPNRPFCRCTTIPMRKLPENIVHKGGQMYAADEMVGKIEIDMGSLNKTEKRIWVKPTSKRKGHYRKIKGAKKVEEKKKYYSVTDIPEYDKEISAILNDLDDRLESGEHISAAVYKICGSPKFGGVDYVSKSRAESTVDGREFSDAVGIEMDSLGTHLSEDMKKKLGKVHIIQSEIDSDRSHCIRDVITINVFHNLRGDINVDYNAVVHEYGHFIEMNIKEVNTLCKNFYDKRCGGEELVSLNDLFPLSGYGKDEVTRKDNFLEPYMGKIYRDVDTSWTEIMSMGFAKMAGVKSKEELYAKDKEYFGLILAVMAGKIS